MIDRSIVYFFLIIFPWEHYAIGKQNGTIGGVFICMEQEQSADYAVSVIKGRRIYNLIY